MCNDPVRLLKNPFEHLTALELALADCVKVIYTPGKHDIDGKQYYIGLRGSFGDHHLNPRTLRARHLGGMISLEGIVTRCSLVRPKMVKSVHWNEAQKVHVYREYRDAHTSGNAPPTGVVVPQVDDNGNKLSTEFGFSIFRDQQSVSIQEMPERAPPGQLPRSVEVYMFDDLVDKVKPGDRIQLVGLYKAVGGARNVGSAIVG